MIGESVLRIGILIPEILGTYRGTNNAIVLRERTCRRGTATEVVKIGLFDAIPRSLDIYALRGGEDTTQSLAAQRLRENPSLIRALDAERLLLAICASLQVLGHWHQDARDRHVTGLGILDIMTDLQGPRSIGELMSEPIPEGLTEALTGFENHGGETVLGPEAKPLSRAVKGAGNGMPEDCEPTPIAYDGVAQGSIIATYMHGPYLARNLEFADLLISRATDLKLEPLEVPGAGALRAEHLGTLGV